MDICVQNNINVLLKGVEIEVCNAVKLIGHFNIGGRWVSAVHRRKKQVLSI